MTVEIGSLVIKASFTDDSIDKDHDEILVDKAVSRAERRILDQVADMISEAFRRREER